MNQIFKYHYHNSDNGPLSLIFTECIVRIFGILSTKDSYELKHDSLSKLLTQTRKKLLAEETMSELIKRDEKEEVKNVIIELTDTLKHVVLARKKPVERGRAHVADMDAPRGAGCKAECGFHKLPELVPNSSGTLEGFGPAGNGARR